MKLNNATLFYIWVCQGVPGFFIYAIINGFASLGFYKKEPNPVPSFRRRLDEGYGPDLLLTSFLLAFLSWMIDIPMVTRDIRLKEVGCCFGDTPLIRPARPKFFDWFIFKYWFVGCDLLNTNIWRNKKRLLAMFLLNTIRGILFGIIGGVLFWGMPVCLITHLRHIKFHYPFPIVLVDALYFGIMGYFVSVILVYIALITETTEKNTYTSTTMEGDYFPDITDEIITTELDIVTTDTVTPASIEEGLPHIIKDISPTSNKLSYIQASETAPENLLTNVL